MSGLVPYTYLRHTLAAPNAGPSKRSSKGSKATKAQLLKLDLGFRPISNALEAHEAAAVDRRARNVGQGEVMHFVCLRKW